MSDPRFCPQGGWVVVENPVPSDPSDVWSFGSGDVFGCNQLHCADCGAAVRQTPGLTSDGNLQPHLAELEQAPDWSQLPFLRPGVGVRLYACRCRAHAAVTRQLCDDDEFDAISDIRLPWRCSGHPPPTLPLELEGLRIDADSDLVALVGRVVDGWVPEGATTSWQQNPATWLGRLYTRLDGLPAAVAVAEAAATHLGDADPSHVGIALFFFRRFPDAPHADAVLDLADAAGADARFPHKAAWSGAQERPAKALAARLLRSDAPVERRAILHLRGAVGRGDELDADIVTALAQHDGEWLAKAAGSVVGDDRDRVGELLGALAKTGREELVAVAGVALAQTDANHHSLRRFLSSAFHTDEAYAAVIRQALP